jgi:hypothetical protein
MDEASAEAPPLLGHLGNPTEEGLPVERGDPPPKDESPGVRSTAETGLAHAEKKKASRTETGELAAA